MSNGLTVRLSREDYFKFCVQFAKQLFYRKHDAFVSHEFYLIDLYNNITLSWISFLIIFHIVATDDFDLDQQ